MVVSWVEAAGIAAAGSLTGVLIWSGGVAGVFGVCAALAVLAAALVFRLRVPALAGPPQDGPAVAAGLGASVRLAARQPRLRLVLALLTAEAVVVGALDLLFVILAVTVLGRPQAWAGYLNSAYGVGAVLAAGVGVLLVGRRLGGPILGAALLLAGALAVLAAGLDPAGTVLLLMVAGTSRALLDVAARPVSSPAPTPRYTRWPGDPVHDQKAQFAFTRPGQWRSGRVPAQPGRSPLPSRRRGRPPSRQGTALGLAPATC